MLADIRQGGGRARGEDLGGGPEVEREGAGAAAARDREVGEG